MNFDDLTPYSYGAAPGNGALNIGWLATGTAFPQVSSHDLNFVERLWRFCKVSVGQTRGLHECEFCRSPKANEARRDGEELLLGSAEIRVFSKEGQCYAAPNLIYHYVVDHNYSPPPEFVQAVLLGPCPPDNAYHDILSNFGVDWGDTLIPSKNKKSFRFVKTPEGIFRIEE